MQLHRGIYVTTPYLWLVEHLNYLSNQSVASWPALWAGPDNWSKMLLLEQWTVSAEYQITKLIAYNSSPPLKKNFIVD